MLSAILHGHGGISFREMKRCVFSSCVICSKDIFFALETRWERSLSPLATWGFVDEPRSRHGLWQWGFGIGCSLYQHYALLIIVVLKDSYERSLALNGVWGMKESVRGVEAVVKWLKQWMTWVKMSLIH